MSNDDATWPHKFTNHHGDWWRARLTSNGLTIQGSDVDGLRRNVPLAVCKQGVHFVVLHLAIVFNDEELAWLQAVLMTVRS